MRLFIMLFFLATAASAQTVDLSLRLDEYQPGSFIVLKSYQTSTPMNFRLVSHVYAGRRGDEYRLQIYRGQYPDGELALVQFLNGNGQVIEETSYYSGSIRFMGPVQRYMGPAYGFPNNPVFRITGEHVTASYSFYPPDAVTRRYPDTDCKKVMGNCRYPFNHTLSVIYNNTPFAGGYHYEEYRKPEGRPIFLNAQGDVELDEVGLLKYKSHIFRNGPEHILEQIEAHYIPVVSD